MRARLPFTIACLSSLLLLGADPQPKSGAAPAQAVPPPAPSAQDLARQRLEVARQGLEQCTRMYQHGMSNTDELGAWTHRVAQAIVQLGPDHEERLNLLRDHLRTAQALEQMAGRRIHAGMTTQLDATTAKWHRLEVQKQLAELENKP